MISVVLTPGYVTNNKTAPQDVTPQAGNFTMARLDTSLLSMQTNGVGMVAHAPPLPDIHHVHHGLLTGWDMT